MSVDATYFLGNVKRFKNENTFTNTVKTVVCTCETKLCL